MVVSVDCAMTGRFTEWQSRAWKYMSWIGIVSTKRPLTDFQIRRTSIQRPNQRINIFISRARTGNAHQRPNRRTNTATYYSAHLLTAEYKYSKTLNARSHASPLALFNPPFHRAWQRHDVTCGSHDVGYPSTTDFLGGFPASSRPYGEAR